VSCRPFAEVVCSLNIRNPTVSATGNIPSIIALSDEARVEMAVLGSDMDSFLSYLLFWQDTVDHCRSVEVNDTLLDHFEVIFLQQLLYVHITEIWRHFPGYLLTSA
jgi:retinoic acid induced 16-like protein